MRLKTGVVSVLMLSVAVASADRKAEIGTAGELRKLFDSFKFSEGPAPDRNGDLYFTDPNSNRIHRVDAKGELSTFLEDMRYTNGLMVDRGRLIAAQRDEGRVISIDLRTKAVAVIADKFEGSRFIGPNDVVVDRSGGVYFTDPRMPTSPRGFQEKEGVYYVAAEGAVKRLVEGLPRPNGVILSPDEKTLYVLFSGRTDVLAYPVLGPGRIGAGTTLCELDQAKGTPPRGGDGLAVAEDGTLYVAQPDLRALQVVSPEGKTLGFIEVPGHPTNAEFGGKDMKTLFITAHTRNPATGLADRAALYSITMKKKGHRFGRK